MASTSHNQPVQETTDPLDEDPAKSYVHGMENIIDEHCPLTLKQQEEEDRIIQELVAALEIVDYELTLQRKPGLESIPVKEYAEIGKEKNAREKIAILRMRVSRYHHQATPEDFRILQILYLKMAKRLYQQGLNAGIINVNFLQRLQSRALYKFFRNHMLMDVLEKEEKKRQEERKKKKPKTGHFCYDVTPPKTFLKIMEEDADDIDTLMYSYDLRDEGEAHPAFIFIDETCKEVERIDESLAILAHEDSRFHFWSTSSFAHGTPPAEDRHRLHMIVPHAIKQAMEMIDIDDAEDKIVKSSRPDGGLLNLPVLPKFDENYNIRHNLDKLHVKLICHKKDHVADDVWDCRECGLMLADYLNNIINIHQPDLKMNDIFIVGSIDRFEKMVTLQNLQIALLENGINSEVLFCRHAVRIQDIIERMKNIVVSDSISMRGIDGKKIVIIIPSPYTKMMKHYLADEKELAKEVEHREPTPFIVPGPEEEDDVLYELEESAGKELDEIDILREIRLGVHKRPAEEIPNVFRRFRDLSYEEKMRRIHFKFSDCRPTLKRAMNSLQRDDKNMILDVFTDGPQHAIFFHFSDEHDSHRYDTDEFW